jgi:hypothetical protein
LSDRTGRARAKVFELIGVVGELEVEIGIADVDFAEKLAASSEAFLSHAVGHKTEVSNSGEASGKNVQQEATQELWPGERHCARTAGLSIAILECHVAVVESENASVGNRHSMRIGGEILEDRLR